MTIIVFLAVTAMLSMISLCVIAALVLVISLDRRNFVMLIQLKFWNY